ncbi:MAG: InlB B-repeat-containing protein [Clostridia bacterium]|nr:InlB B-repeat-containing protein [Clostridia bacterium]
MKSIRLKSMLAALLALVMLASVLPAGAFAKTEVHEEHAEQDAPVFRDEDWKKWSQSDSRWGSIRLGSSTNTMASSGCLVVSLAKLAIQAGCRNPNYYTPYNLVTDLNNNGGFNSGGALNSSSQAASLIGNGFTFVDETEFYEGYWEDPRAIIRGYVQNGEQVILRVSGGEIGVGDTHFVAVDNERTLNSTYEVYIFDTSWDSSWNEGCALFTHYKYAQAAKRFRGPSSAYLDLNGVLDGSTSDTLGSYGTVDVYINDTKVADDVSDYYAQYSTGTKYEFRDIKPCAGYSYDGCSSGSRTGYLTGGTTTYSLSFSTINVDSVSESPEVQTFNGHSYLYYTTPVSWFTANAFCEANGGHLATVTSAAENAYIASLIPSSDTYLWLGGTDYGTDNNWSWTTGEDFAYSNWDSSSSGSEPNDNPNDNVATEDYLMIKSTGLWNDCGGYPKYGFVLEIDSLPHEHSMVFVPAMEPTCTNSGNIDYWYCAGCGKYFSDSEGLNELSDVAVQPLGHSYTTEEVGANCQHPAGTVYTCSRCGYYYLHAADECYSEWSTEYPEGVPEWLIESHDGYRQRKYETVESYDPSLTDMDLIGSDWELSGTYNWDYITSWSPGFSRSSSYYTQYNKSALTNSETETEKTVINSAGIGGYLYWHWCTGRTDGPNNNLISDEYESPYTTFHCFYSTTDPSGYYSQTGSTNPPTCYCVSNGDCCLDTYWYFCTPINRQNYSTYRKVYTYGYWGEWGDWSLYPLTPAPGGGSESEKTTLYRYIVSGFGDHVWDDGEVTDEPSLGHEGTMTYTCTLCGATRNESIPAIVGHTVVFRDWNGDVLKIEVVAHGEAATAPADPEREGYTFTGWDKDFSNITTDTDVTAQYTVNIYTVTYYLDGELYTTEQVEYSAAIPLPDVDEAGYTFSGWMLSDGSAVPAAMPADDLSVYGMLTRNYVTVIYTGAYNGTAEVPYGGNAELPVLEAEGVHYTFTVNGEPWDGTNLTEDVTVEVGMDINVYTVQFVDPIDNAVLDTQQITHGQNAAAPSAPEHYGYTFDGWDKAFTNVKSDLTVNAIYTPVSYTVIFMDGCDNVIEIQSVPYGAAAAAPEVPAREGWTFAGWDTDISCIEHDLVVNATWSRNYYTVTFTGVYTGTVVVEHGCDCDLPVYNSNSIHYTFTVNGEPWDGKNITSDVTVTVGVAVNGTYTVTFVDWDGTVLDTQTISYGNAAIAPADPVRQGYTFTGWDVDFSYITGDLTVTATYTASGPAVTLLGDVDLDGEVTAADALLAMRHAMSITVVSGQGFVNGDMDGDGSINATDAILIMRAVMGM